MDTIFLNIIVRPTLCLQKQRSLVLSLTMLGNEIYTYIFLYRDAIPLRVLIPNILSI